MSRPVHPGTGGASRARRPRALAAAALAVVLLAAGLAGCSTPLPEPSPDSTPAVVPPALGEAQLDRILGQLDTALAAADSTAIAATTAPDPVAARQVAVDALGQRLTGPAAQMRAAQYALATKAGAGALTPVPSGAQTVVDPATDTWPRVLMVVTKTPEDLRAPLLLTLVQASPRAQYQLWSWQRLFGGVTVPRTMQAAVGTAPLAPDDTTAAVSPKDAMAHYLDVLTQGAASPFVASFTADPLRTRIAEQRAAWQAAVGAGTLAETYTPTGDGPWAMATADGGAIVVGAFQTTTTLTLANSTLTLSDATTALLGKDTITANLALTWTGTVAFAVPPAGSTDPITVLGAEYVLVQAAGQ